VPSATNAQQQKTSLFDHLVGAGKQRRWHGEVERLRSLEIDDERKSGGNAWLWNDRSCEGLRMPALEGEAAHTGAGVRKPPKEEIAREVWRGGASDAMGIWRL
jgi:hypothetical protein